MVLVAAIALMVCVVAGLLGGPGTMLDVDLIRALAEQRAAHPAMTSIAILLTNGGGVTGMIAILSAVLAIMAFHRRWKDAAMFAGTVLGGRLVIELLKLLVDRPRPAFGPYPVGVSSMSFPSGHAGNSMITFLAIALIVVPARYRAVAASVTVLLSGMIGATRPFLGVHWPSDVVAGWAFGIAWVVSLSTASDYWRASRANRAA